MPPITVLGHVYTNGLLYWTAFRVDTKRHPRIYQQQRHGNGIGRKFTNIKHRAWGVRQFTSTSKDSRPCFFTSATVRISVHIAPKCAENLFDMWCSTFEIGAAQLRSLCYRNSTEIMAFMSDPKPYRVWFSCWGKGYQLECKHSLIRKYEIFQLPTTRGNQDDDSKKLYLQTNNFIFGLIIYDRRDTNRLSWTVPSSVSTESSAKWARNAAKKSHVTIFFLLTRSLRK